MLRFVEHSDSAAFPLDARLQRRQQLTRALLWLCSIMLQSALLAPSSVADTSKPNLEEIARAFGFEPAQVEAIRAGETVSGQLESNSDNELALSMAFLSTHDVGWHLDRLEKSHTSDPSIHAMREMVGDGRASLAELEIPAEELDRLAEAEPGMDVNLSSDEITQLREAARTSKKKDEQHAAVQSAMREILAGRFAAYKNGGLAALAPYARRRGGESFPSAQLERAFEALRVTSQITPDVYEAMANFPAAPGKNVTSRFTWILHEAQDRLVVALSHVVFGLNDDRLAAIERRYYVSHTLNSLQVVAVAIPIAEGTAIFYANRTGTDQVTGFGSSVAKSIGRKIMRGELEVLVGASQKSAEQSTSEPSP
jgi:hypothetical protein